MARPKKNNVDYFSHDVTMRNHRKIKALRNKFWITWYWIWCMLLEHIWSCDFFETKWDEIETEMLAGDFGVSVAEIQQVVSFCVRLDLLQLEQEILKSQSFIDRLQPLLEKRSRERNRVSVAESPHSKVKYSKVKLFTYVNNTEGLSEQIKEKIKNFIEHREAIKAKMTQQALTLFVNKIKGFLEKKKEAEIVDMIEKAIMSWRKSIYDKSDSKKKKQEHEENRDDFTFNS